jgi:hypothetical protein
LKAPATEQGSAYVLSAFHIPNSKEFMFIPFNTPKDIKHQMLDPFAKDLECLIRKQEKR